MNQAVRTTNELMSNLTINSQPDPEEPSPPSSSSSTHPPQPSLSKLPLEIKQNIVHWLILLGLEDAEFRDDDSNIEEVDDQEVITNLRSEPNHQSNPKSNSKITRPKPSSTSIETHDGQDNQSDKENKPYSDPLHALSLVDRTFYDLCRPSIWHDVDLEKYTLTKLKQFRSEILVRQAEYVRTLWWRSTLGELEEFVPEVWMDEIENVEWDDELRSIELLGILESCTKVICLDIDLYCPNTPEFLDKDGKFIPQNSTTWKFVEPVSKLTHLTAIALTAAGEIPFQELFLVQLIRDMNHLKSFTCCLVRADAPNFETSKSISVCQSPLGLHLASLSSLRAIDLDQTECFDMSWSTIEWQGRLDSITLDDCSRATLRTIHQFCMKFSSTLTYLELDDLPSDQEDTTQIKNQIDSGKYRFELPKLRSLSISNELPISFLRLFEDSKGIELLQLGINSEYTAQDLESIVIKKGFEGGFPSITKVIISLGDSDITMGEIEALELFYFSHGVGLQFENDSSDDEDDEDDEEEEEDNDVLSGNENDSVDYQLDVEVEHEWEEEQDEDDVDDDDLEIDYPFFS